MKNYKTIITAVAAGLACSVLTASADLVVNGGFDNSGSTVGQIGYGGSFGSPAGWSVLQTPSPAVNPTAGSYDFLFNGPGAVSSSYGPNNVALAGGVTASPNGGNFFGADPQFYTAGVSGISQLISGLTVGQNYIVSFFYAASQQVGYTGPTTEGWTVSLGAQSFSTLTINNPSQTFSGWIPKSFVFTATDPTETLKFLAFGGPNGSAPPFALLDGVSMAVPEPTTIAAGALMLIPLGISAVRILRRKEQTTV